MHPMIHVVTSCQFATSEIMVKCWGAGSSQRTLGLKADHVIWWLAILEKSCVMIAFYANWNDSVCAVVYCRVLEAFKTMSIREHSLHKERSSFIPFIPIFPDYICASE